MDNMAKLSDEAVNIMEAHPDLFYSDGRACNELGLFSDEGCIEDSIYTATEAVNALARYSEDELTLEPMCCCGTYGCECAEGGCECDNDDDREEYDNE